MHPSNNLLTMATLLERAARQFGQRPAIVDYERNMNWSEYVSRISRAATILSDMGIQPGQRFGIISRNSFRFAELINAAYWLGAVPVPINFRLANSEIRYILDDSDCQCLAVDDTYSHLLDEELLAPWKDRTLLVSPTVRENISWPQYEVLLAEVDPHPIYIADQQDDAILLYTGGTTGRCKGVRLTHSNLIGNGMQLALACRAYEDDVYLHIPPMFHSADLMGTVFTLVGGAHCYLGEFSTTNLLKAIQDHRITVVMLAPTVIIMTLQDPEFDNYDLNSIRLAFYGSAPLAAEWIKKVIEKLPNADLQQGYGLTETSPILTTFTPSAHRHAIESGDHGPLSSVGKPVQHVDLRIFDAEDNELPIGEIGEVVVRGPNVTKGYLGLPEQNAEVFRNGWFHTGDVGRLDEDYNLYLMDRKKDMIITGSENVYSLEVEVALYKHPGISEVAVVGLPHKKWGEEVFAAIVPAAGCTLTEEEIIAHCREHIGGYKIPRNMAFMDELPKTAMGKVQKNELRRIYGPKE